MAIELVNELSLTPLVQTKEHIHTSQEHFEQAGSSKVGCSTSSTPGSIVGNEDLGIYRSAIIDLGLKTKLASAVITKGGSARVFARSGSVASVSPIEVKRTTQEELEAGVGTSIITAPNPTLVGQNGNHEYAYGSISALADPLTGSSGFGSQVLLGIGTSASDQTFSPFLYRLSDGTYRLYYQYRNGTYWRLSYRTSVNGITGWSTRTDLGIGSSGSDQAVSPFLYRLSDGTYRLYYTYSNGIYWQLAYRTSVNGITGWSVQVLLGIGSSTSDQASVPVLYRLADGTYRLYYTYYNGTYYQLVYRTSADGITNWSAQVLLGIGSSITDWAQSPFLYHLSDGIYRLYYSYFNGTYWQLVYRTSVDGITGWSAQILLGIGSSTSNQAYHPFLYRLSDGTYRLYYTYYNGTYLQLVYRTQSMEASVSTYESDTLTLSSSAQGDKLPIQANVPANTTLSYKVRAGETATPDVNWSAWTATTSVVSGLNIFNLSALTGKYWQVGFDGTSNGSATWSMGGFSVIPKAPNYSSLIEIVNPADIQGLAAERYLQYLALGVNTWNVDDITLQAKFQAIDLKHADFSIGNINLKNLVIVTTDEIYNIALANTETATFNDADFFDAATVSTVDLVAKTAIADNLTQARWIAANILATTPAACVFAVYAKEDLNNSVSQRLKMFEADGITEVAKVGTGEDQAYNIPLDILENKMDSLPTPATNGEKYYIEAVTAGNKVLKSVGFKVTGEGAQYLYFSETDDFATAVKADTTYFNFASDIVIGTMIPFYVWADAPVGASVGLKNVEFTYWKWITGE